jgi:hypothetical protein
MTFKDDIADYERRKELSVADRAHLKRWAKCRFR